MRVHRSVQVQFEAGESRTETLLGREYYVVPTVAMIEGVRYGANQSEPELGLASEFGKNPQVWANKPLCLGHPQVDGEFVSANSPEVLETYSFGMTMNPYVEDGKLKMEAWIDVALVEEKGGEFEETLQRIKDQEEVEVSVGFWSDLDKQKGTFKGQKYGAIWRNIVPDHLAILEEGTIGACSVKDGCGIPRINKGMIVMTTTPKPKTTVTPQNTNDVKPQCSCGGAHTQEEHQDDEQPVTQGGLKKIVEDLLKPFKSAVMTPQQKAEEAHVASGARAQNETAAKSALEVHKVDGSLLSRDVHTMLSNALSSKFPQSYVYLLGYTQEVAVYERYSSDTGRFATYQIKANVSTEKVEFVGEPEEVILQTKIVPQKAGDPTVTTQEENDMSGEDKSKTPATTQEAPKNPTTQEAPKVLTTQEYIDNAPPEIREMLQAQKKTHDDKRNALVGVLKGHAANKFSDDELKAMSLETLEKTAALLPGTYVGLAAPTQIQATGEKGQTVAVQKAFPGPKKQEEKQAA